MAVSDCIFCQIAAGTAACAEIYRDNATLAFMDINPANDGHCLVIPKAHFENALEMPPALFGTLASAAAKVARAVNEVLRPGGISLVQANGEAAGQSVIHVHIHVLPRREGDDLRLNWDRDRPASGHRDGADIAEIARRLRARLGAGG